MIEVQGLSKRYGDLQAIDAVSFSARPGQIFGLLGPNGAGKSSIIGCISGLLKPDAGRIVVAGVDLAEQPRQAKAQLGIVPQELALYEELSARANLDYWARLYGVAQNQVGGRVQETLAQIGLADRADEPCKRFSGGMKRRLNFGCALVHQPRVLLLDEPSVGVDPQSRERLLDMVREQAAQGTCVLYTTHYMEEAEELCHHLAILDHGEIIASGSMAALREQVRERDLVVLEGQFPEMDFQHALPASLEVEVSHADPRQLRLLMADAPRKLSTLLTQLQSQGAEIRETALTRPGLESLFIKLTGKGLRE